MPSAPRIVVIGSSNTDMVARCPRIPSPGETLLGGEFRMVRGGKGANQAVAAARLGAQVTFLGCVGDDAFGELALAGLQEDCIDTSHVKRVEGCASGVALIAVADSGENSIVVAPGANARLTPEDVIANKGPLEECDVAVVQFETPLPTVRQAIEICASACTRIIVNPAPAASLPVGFLDGVDVLVPNEHEAAQLLGASTGTLEKDAQRLRCVGPRNVVITAGSQGCVVFDGDETTRLPSFLVQAIDTTAAGDAFTGALAVGLAEGKTLLEAARWASAAAAISVTREGAQPSLPFRTEVEEFFSRHN